MTNQDKMKREMRKLQRRIDELEKVWKTENILYKLMQDKCYEAEAKLSAKEKEVDRFRHALTQIKHGMFPDATHKEEWMKMRDIAKEALEESDERA